MQKLTRKLESIKKNQRKFQNWETNLQKLRAQKMDLTAKQRTSELQDKSVDKLVWGTEKVKMENSEKSIKKYMGHSEKF